MYYESRVKDEYHRRLAALKKDYYDATEEERESGIVEPPVPLKVMNIVGQEFWELETVEFRESVRLAAEEAHERAVEKRKESIFIPDTPQQFHQ